MLFVVVLVSTDDDMTTVHEHKEQVLRYDLFHDTTTAADVTTIPW